MPEADVDQVRGLGCAEAEELAAKMREKGFAAKAVPVEP
jgi:hypothetical protein